MITSTLNHIRSLSVRRKSMAGNQGPTNGHQQPSSRKKSTDRTTRLLIVILVLFLLTEFPQVSNVEFIHLIAHSEIVSLKMPGRVTDFGIFVFKNQTRAL